jgi:predicted AlkP superfamily phosphohydrolase/phosphomutase
MPSKSEEKKIIVIGWDGATWDLLVPWLEAGELPNLASLMKSGSFGTVKSTALPLSPAAWSTIITGQNPGKHGVFDWFERKPGSYDVDYVNTGRIATKTIWQFVNEAGKQMGVFSLPMIYPATPIDGFMVSGMAAPNAKAAHFTYPESLLEELESNVGPFLLAEEEVFQYGRESAYVDSLLRWLAYQNNAAKYLIKNKQCDIYLFVFMQTDHAQHKLWRYIDPGFPDSDPDRDAQYKDSLLRVYQAMDRNLGDLMSFIDDDTSLLVLSDHGAGPCHGIMYVNRWLRKEGLLSINHDINTRFKSWLAKHNFFLRGYKLISKLGLGWLANMVSKPARNRVLSGFLSFDDVDWAKTKAYSRGAFGQIYINLEGREPQGIVKQGDEYERLVSEIMQKLAILKHPESGGQLITDIRRSEEVFHGPCIERAADIIFSVQDYLFQSSVKFDVEGDGILGKSEYDDSGTHRIDGILVMAGSGIKQGERIQGAQVADITPTLLALADVPVPNDLDGRILEEALSDEQKNRIQRIKPTEVGKVVNDQAMDLDTDEKSQLEERLRNLGYLG